MYRHGAHGSEIAAQAMGQSSWQRTGLAHVAMIMLIMTIMKIITMITLRKCGSFGFPAAPAVALLSLLAPGMISQISICFLVILFINCSMACC